jgi:glutathione S-transferase
MKLYYTAPSPNSYVVTAVAEYLQIPLEKIPVDLAKGEGQKPEYLKLNPNGKTPTLVDGDFVLWESNAILLYLANKKKPELWPADERSGIEITRWLIWQQTHWLNSCGILLWEYLVKRFFQPGDPDPAQIKKGEAEVRRFGAVLNQCLEGKKFLVGDRLSLADFAVSSPLPYAKLCRFPLDGLSNLHNWYERILGLQAWQKNLPQFPGM